MSYSVSWEKRGAYITHSEQVCFKDFMEAVQAIHANENYASIQYVIHDMSGASALNFADLDMTTIIAHELGARYTNPKVRPAIVSTHAKMSELVNIFSQITKLDVGLFPTVEDARAWVEKQN
jgi:hypothetical protein